MTAQAEVTRASMSRAPQRGSTLVVVDLDDSRTGYVALERVGELAYETDIHVLGRIDPRSGASMVVHRRRLRDLLQEASGLLPEHACVTSEIRRGDLVKVALAAGTELRPHLIVIGMNVSGTSGVSIADALSAPVLIARRPTQSNGIVVASDVKSEAMPVLGAARRTLGARGHAITLFHAACGDNGRCMLLSSIDKRGFDRFACARLLALQQLAIDDEVRIMVSEEGDKVDAITHLAEDAQADVVAVGFRQRPTFGRPERRTAQDVIDRCSCSVLVVPMARDPEIA
jgi:nucleotide-binding universal stress UspA family protein